MRKKTNLTARLDRCADLLIEDPQSMKGKWRQENPEFREIHVELGCGKGTFTAAKAEEEPEVLLIAVEKVPEALVMAMEKAKDKNLSNVRFLDFDAAGLADIFDAGEVDRIYINFCDPWPKSHDAKHRLTAPGFLRKYADVLTEKGQIYFKTDNDPLFEWSLQKFEEEGWELTDVNRDLHKEGPCGIMTDYEAKFYAQHISINQLIATKTTETKDGSDGEPPRMYQAGIARPYRTSELFSEGHKQEEEADV